MDIDDILPPLAPLSAVENEFATPLTDKETLDILFEIECFELRETIVDDWEVGILPELLYRIKWADLELPLWYDTNLEKYVDLDKPFWFTKLMDETISWVENPLLESGYGLLKEIHDCGLKNLEDSFARAVIYLETH